MNFNPAENTPKVAVHAMAANRTAAGLIVGDPRTSEEASSAVTATPVASTAILMRDTVTGVIDVAMKRLTQSSPTPDRERASIAG